MKQYKIIETTPKTIVRIIIFLMMSYFIYKETGIVTTLFIGIMFIELGIYNDWFLNLHKLVMDTHKFLKIPCTEKTKEPHA